MISEFLFPLLKDRLNNTDQQLNKSDFIRKGIFQYPEGFTKRLPFDLFMDSDGKVKHNFDFDSINTSGQSVYVSYRRGVDTNSGLEQGKAVRTLTKAMDIANALSGSSVNVVFLEPFYSLTNQTLETFYLLNKNFNLLSDLEGGSYFTTGQPFGSHTWVQDESVYKTSRTAVTNVYDYLQKDFKGFN